MTIINSIAIAIMSIFIGILYNKYRYKYGIGEDFDQYKLIKKYLLEDSSLSNTKKPLLWIHLNYNKNSRKWESFYSRTSTDLNQPYQYLTINSIINHCGKSFNIVIIDDNTFTNIIPGWSHDMSLVPYPIKNYLRELAMAKILYSYGGMIVPSSFICTKNLIDVYNKYYKNGPFIGEFVNKNITNQMGSQFCVNTKFMGSLKENPHILSLINYIEVLLSTDYTDESEFNGNISEKCQKMIESRKIIKIDGGIIGTKNIDNKPVMIDELMGDSFIEFMPSCYGIYIPAYEILMRTNFEWFARMNTEQVLSSNTNIGKLLLINTIAQ